jgi:serine/threonine protein kinase
VTADIPCPHCFSPNPPGPAHCRTCGASLTLGYSAGLPAGTKLRGGQYVIERVLGEGGFGITYRAMDTNLGTVVALKELFPAQSASRGNNGEVQYTRQARAEATKLRDRFKQEAQLLLRIRHPAVVRVLGVFEENETAYLAMELLEGQTLQSRLTLGGPLSEGELRAFAAPLLGALEEMHTQGILHRDIKPENIILTRSGPVLIDFGTALGYAPNQTLVVTSQVLTPAYAPLEQYATSARVGPPTDLYALGATLYHALTGRIPVSSMDRASGSPLEPIQSLMPQVSSLLAALIESCLSLPIAERPQSASEVRAMLGVSSTQRISVVPPSVVQPQTAPTVRVQVGPVGTGVSAVPTNAPVQSARQVRPGSLVALWSLAAVAVLGVGGAAWWLTRPADIAVPSDKTDTSFVARQVEVRATELNIRNGPGSNNPVIKIGTAALRVSSGQTLDVEGEQNGWYQVTVNNKQGWVSGRLTLPVQATVDAAELERVAQAIESGGRVELKEGVYSLPRSLNPSTSLELVGAGMDKTYLIGTGSGPTLKFQGPGTFSAHDITFGYRGTTWTPVVSLEDAEVDILNARFIGGTDGDDPSGNEGDGLVVTGGSSGNLKKSEFLTNRWRGLSVKGTSNLTVDDSSFQYNDGSGLVVGEQAKLNITNSRATGNHLQGFKALETSNMTLENAQALDNGGGGIAFDDQSSGQVQRTRCENNQGFALRKRNSAVVQLEASPSCTTKKPSSNTSDTTPAIKAISAEEAKRFADRYLAAGSLEDPQVAAENYADRVQYYGKRGVTRQAVLEDKSAYFTRWAFREYSRVSDVRSTNITAGGRRIEFEYTFSVSDPQRTGVAGKATVALGLERQGGRLVILEESGEILERY